MWRDRTNLYISYRQSYTHHPTKRTKYSAGPVAASSYSDGYASASGTDDTRGLLSAGAFDDDGDAVIEMDLLPPRWADVSDEITDLLAHIAQRSQALDRLHQKHVLPGFDDEETKKEEEREIEKLTQQITKGFHECHRCIQSVEQMVRESRQAGSLSKGEETMAKNIQISLASRVQDASAMFRKKQSAYLKSKLFKHPAPLNVYAFVDRVRAARNERLRGPTINRRSSIHASAEFELLHGP